MDRVCTEELKFLSIVDVLVDGSETDNSSGAEMGEILGGDTGWATK
jgi:hypothetical protein